jgi:hypothetical protein
MAKKQPKKPALKVPSPESVNAVLQAAANCPLRSLHDADALRKAILEVQAFFQALLKPQAAASDAGKPVSQG